LVTGNPLLSTVKVIGAVNKPGAFAEYRGATVLDMLLQQRTDGQG
jgi:protein involved in polysaccharide export with SLBB domain